MSETLELPRPAELVRATGWNLAESFGLPLAAYGLIAGLWGRNAGVLAMLGVIWITAAIRKVATGTVPALVVIALIVLTMQAVLAVATGNLWIFLVHFPLVNLALCIVFARTARGHSPLAERLAADVIGLRLPELHKPRLRRFFRHVTLLWAGVFGLLAVILAALLVVVRPVTYIPVWAGTTIVIIAAGIAVSALWLRSELRNLGIGVCFGPAAAAPGPPAPAAVPDSPAPAAANGSKGSRDHRDG
jgi:uncharacterized membrane protein